MDKRRIALTALVIVGVGLACAALIRLNTLQESVREGLIMPVVFVVWLTRLLLRSIDQPVLWTGGVIILGLILVYGLLAAWPDAEILIHPGRWTRSVRESTEDEAPPPMGGRIDYWQGKIHSLRSQGIHSDYANFEFRRLARATGETIGGETGQPHPPAAIRPFLANGERGGATAAPAAPLGWRFRFTRRRPPPPEEDPLVILCNYLEDQLESRHDDIH